MAAVAKSKGKSLPDPGPAQVIIEPLDFRVASFRIRGTSPLVVNRFSAKAIQQMMESQMAGGTAKARKKREPKDFDTLYEDAKHISHEGWEGIHAAAFRNALISACRTCGVVMTRFKLTAFVRAQGYDRVDNCPLVRIYGEAEKNVSPTRNATGVIDLRARPMYRDWYCDLELEYDAGMIDISSLANLLIRAGRQVGVGEGRWDSKQSAGVGWGQFVVE